MEFCSWQSHAFVWRSEGSRFLHIADDRCTSVCMQLQHHLCLSFDHWINRLKIVQLCSSGNDTKIPFIFDQIQLHFGCSKKLSFHVLKIWNVSILSILLNLSAHYRIPQKLIKINYYLSMFQRTYCLERHH